MVNITGIIEYQHSYRQVIGEEFWEGYIRQAQISNFSKGGLWRLLYSELSSYYFISPTY